MSKATDMFVRDADLPWQAVAPGISRKILTYNERIMLVRVAFEGGAVGTSHSHLHVQCSLVESGVFDVTIAGRTERLHAGDSFIVPANAVHGVVAIEAGKLFDSFTPAREDLFD